jgi:flagellar basal-body rod protein FlgG
MIRALWSSATGMTAQQTNLDVISNNIANVSTNGYKRSRADFQDLLYQTERLQGVRSENGTQVPTGIQIGHGTALASVNKVFMQGEYNQTENQFDLAIEGSGFFQVTMPSGDTAYTRAGSFKSDSEGRLVTADGFLLTPNITVPQATLSVSIEQDGTVSAQVQGQTAAQQLGTIDLATFANPSGLNAIGKSLFLETDASGTPVTGRAGQNGIGNLRQGYLEMSNVNIMQEMVNMIIAQRAYEANSKGIQAADEMLQIAASLRR